MTADSLNDNGLTRSTPLLCLKMNAAQMELDRLIVIRTSTAKQIEQTRELFRKYIAALIAETPAFVDYLKLENFADELRDLPRGYEPPDGLILLGLHDGKTAECVALRKFGYGICEMKRLYVKPQFRALKLGKQLAQMIIAEARGLNYKKCGSKLRPQ